MGFLQRLFGGKNKAAGPAPAPAAHGTSQAVRPNRDAERAAYFDGMADQWDSTMKLSGAQENQLAEILDAFGVPEGSVVVDAGCGTGLLYKFIAPRVGAKGRVFGVDISPKMIERAEAKFAHDQRFTWHTGPIEQLLGEFTAQGVDRIICYSSFAHLSDPQGFLNAAAAALRPGGKLAIIHLASSQEIAGMHAGLEDSPVTGDTLPSMKELSAMAQEASLAVQTAQDKPGSYIFVGASLKRNA